MPSTAIRRKPTASASPRRSFSIGANGGSHASSFSQRDSAITAAALATLYNAGDYDSEHVPDMLAYSKKHLHNITTGARSFGHWHYTYLYYSQVVYRQGADE